jgi:hypothetical protein
VASTCCSSDHFSHHTDRVIFPALGSTKSPRRIWVSSSVAHSTTIRFNGSDLVYRRPEGCLTIACHRPDGSFLYDAIGC